MKRLLSLWSLLMLCIIGTSAQTILYSWESPGGTVAETGGTIAYVNGDGDRLNYKNGDYYTICLNGKKANINDEAASANAGKMVITLNQALQAGDEIAYTAYINKNSSTQASPYIVFENGTTLEGEIFGDEENIQADFGGSPATKISVVPEAAAGSKTVTLTRSKTGTNLFITKLVISRAGGATPTTVDIAVPDSFAMANGYVTTFCSPYALDFSQAEGINAYLGTKKMDSWGEVIETLFLKTVDKVPANTPLIIKADEAKTYTIAIATEEVPAVQTALAVATEDIDLYEAITANNWGKTITGPAILGVGQIMNYDTFEYEDVLGFFPTLQPVAPATEYLPAGTVYLPLTEEDNAGDYYFNGFVALKFADANLVENCNSIVQAKNLEEGTEFILNLGTQPWVSYANEEYFVLEETGAGIFVHAQNSFKAGDILYGSIRGKYSELIGSFIEDADISEAKVIINYADDPSLVSLGDAFTDHVQQLVKLTNLTVHTPASETWTIEDADGNETTLSTILGGAIQELSELKDGDVIEELTGYAVIVPETSMYVQYGLYPTYFFGPVTIKLKEAAPAGNYEVELDFDKSRLPNWAFPESVEIDSEVSIPYTIYSYADDLKNVVVSLIVNGEQADQQTVASIVTDEEMGEGSYNGKFTYKATAAGELKFALKLTFDGAAEEYETEEVTINVVEAAAPTSVDIAVASTLSDGTSYYRTFSSQYPLDFSNAEGIKAYYGKKNILYDSWDNIDASEVILTAVEGVVPANTGVVLKADAAATYTVPVAELVYASDAADNDLLVATEKTDLYPLTDGFNYGVATLDKRFVSYYDLSSWGYVEEDAVGFFPVYVPTGEGIEFLEAGDVYLPLSADEIEQMSHYGDVAKLKFTDAALPVANNIAALKALGDGDATLNFQYTGQVTFVNDRLMAVEDYTGGLFIERPDGIDIPLGSILSGSISGTYNGSLLYPVLQKSAQTKASDLLVYDDDDVIPQNISSLSDAFEQNHLMRLVKLSNLKVTVESDGWDTIINFVDENGSEVQANNLILDEQIEAQLLTLMNGDQIEEVTGYAYIIPETSMYAAFGYALYQFQPVSIKLKEPVTGPKPYEFVAAEWPAGDPGRISPENVTVDAAANTITVSKDGNNNVALKFVSTNEYYVTPEQRYFTIRATGLSTEEGKSYLWWLNNANHGSQVAPSTIYEDGGVTVFAWDIRTCGLGDNFSSTENTTLQTTGDWITTFGMTLADQAVPAVISYIGFETTVPEPIKEYEYSFVATEWPAGDPGRISPSNVVVDEAANTITVDAKGQNNVALNFKTDRVLYVKPVVKYFVIQATGLSTTEGDSYLWWLNAKNNGGQVVPTYAVQKGDVVSLIWDITTDATFASGFNAEGNSYLDGTGASTWGWTTTFGLTLADQNVPAVISYIGYENEESELVKEALKEDPVEPTYSYPATWDFTQWSEATVSNLKADAAASIFTGWSDVEKNPATEGNPQEPTDATRDNCFWHQGQPDVYGQLYANGQLISELKGLKFYDQYAGARSLAIAVNYPSTSLGDYAGASYLWLGGGGKSVPCFELPGVPAGMSITMEVESHKTTDARGVELYAGSIDAANKIGDSFKPTTKASYTWNVTEAANIVVYNTSGCHIYSIKVAPMVVDGIHSISLDAASGSIYDLQGRKVEQPRRGGLYIQNGKKVVVK